MAITDVRINKVFKDENSKLRATASITFDDCFAVHSIKVLEGKDSNLYVDMPDWKDKSGKWHDIAHPINNDTRTEIVALILDKYNAEIDNCA